MSEDLQRGRAPLSEYPWRSKFLTAQSIFRTPPYLQLVEHLKRSIETGAIKAGERLPSVRRMAEDLLINRNTVVRD